MRKVIKWLVLVGSILAFSPIAGAQDTTEPSIEWNDSTRLALGQCLVGEAGWRNRTEHSVLAHVLERRWRMVRARRATYTFEQMVRSYCSVHRVSTPSPRQTWVRALPWGTLTSDPGFPATVDWNNYVGSWDFVRETVALFEAGTLTDPLPDAIHWGSGPDGVPIGGILLARTVSSVEDGEPVTFHNHFYDIDYAVVRAYRAYRRRLESGDTGPVSVEGIGRSGT